MAGITQRGKAASKVFLRILVINIVVVLTLTILPQMFLFSWVSQGYETEVQQLTLGQVSQLRYNVDDLVLAKAVDLVHLNFSDTQANEDLTWGFLGDLNREPFRLIALYQALSAVPQVNPSIDQFGVYYPHSQVWADNYGVRLLQSKTGTKGVDLGWFDRWLGTSAGTWTLRPTHPDTGAGPSLVYVDSVPPGSSSDQRWAVVSAEIELSTLGKSLAGFGAAQDGGAYLVDAEGKVMVAGSSSPELPVAAGAFVSRVGGKTTGTFRVENHGRPWIVGFAASRYTKAWLVSALPLENVQSRFQPILTSMLVLALVLLAFDLLVAFLLARATHKPIGTLLSSLKELASAGLTPPPSNNPDRGLVVLAYQRILKSLDALSLGIDTQRQVIRQNLLLRALKGPDALAGLGGSSEGLSLLGWETGELTVFTVKVRTPGEGGPQEELVWSARVSELLAAALAGRRTESLLDEGGRLVFLLGIDNAEQFHGILGKLEEVLARLPQHNLCLCFGRRHPVSIPALALAYQESLDAERASFWLSDHSIVDGAALPGRFQKTYTLPPSFLGDLSAALKAARSEETEAMVRRLGADLGSCQWTLESCRDAVRDVLFETRRAFLAVNVAVEASLGYLLQDHWGQLATWREFLSWYASVVALGCHELKAVRASFVDTLPERIATFVASHLDQELSLSVLAEGVDFSASYLSRIFKSLMGASYNDYVTGAKLGEAERLLLTTGLGVKEVAYKLGYHSVPHFVRLFRGRYGASPTEYRRQKRAEQP